MTSIIKVDQIQNAAGGTPTAGDLGLNVSGSVLQRQFVEPLKYNETGHYGTSRFTPSVNMWSSPNVSGIDYEITFNAKNSSSKVLIEASGSTYGSGSSAWVGLHKDRIVANDGTNYNWPEWRQAVNSSISNHTSFYIRRYFESSTWDGKTFHFQVYPHSSNNSFRMFEDLMITVTEIKQ